MDIKSSAEIFRGEGLKTAAEIALSGLSKLSIGEKLIETYAFGFEGRIEDPALHTTVANVEFENPVLFGAGWDKKGRAINGLYALGFAGGEVGTVLPFGQYGNPKPRLWTINKQHSVGLNRLGFNSPGQEVVDEYLSKNVTSRFPIGINVGRNKIMPNEMAPWAHATVIESLGKYASYVVLGISSPNTPDLRGLQEKGPLRENIQASKEAIGKTGKDLGLYIKIDAERSEAELDDMMQVAIEEGIAGFVATNTFMGSELKAKYGERWAREAGGLSGADPDYRLRSTKVVRYIYEKAGDKLAIIGAGGVNNVSAAIDKLASGASAIQVVTAIRPSKGKIAAEINRGLLEYMEVNGVKSIREVVGVATKRGAK